MNPQDPNVQLLEVVAQALGELRDEVVFVGGCAAGLLCTSPAAPPPRVTYDVDVITGITALAEYHQMEARLEARGFSRDLSPDAPICRWRIKRVTLDLMPTDKRVLGFTSRWYSLAIATASELVLPNDIPIRLISAPVFLATKFEAFMARGQGDMAASHDFEDIVTVLGGRPGVENEVRDGNSDLRAYLASNFTDIVDHPDFENTLPGLVVYDDIHADRVRVVRQRMTAIAEAEVP